MCIMNMHTKHELTLVVLPRYLKANKGEKTKMLDEYCANTGYERKYAIAKLKEYQMTPNLTFKIPGKHKRRRQRIYDMAVEVALHFIWDTYDRICAERLHPNIKDIVEKLVSCKELKIDSFTEAKLFSMSLATMKRLLKDIRERQYKKIHGTTKPGSLAKSEIPLRVGYWNETKPGFAEMDLVAHCGDYAGGDFANTLNTTDIHTGWFEAQAVLGKSQERTFKALKDIRRRMPFKLLGIDSDNGTEFINWQMIKYCKDENIVFTRSRPYKKNDNAHIEQKNWTCVRKIFGYLRIGERKQIDLMNELFSGPLRLYINFFLPSCKCVERKRIGSKIVKKYDKARTPHQRILESKDVPEKTKKQLNEIYKNLNPVALKKEIDRILLKICCIRSEKIQSRFTINNSNAVLSHG